MAGMAPLDLIMAPKTRRRRCRRCGRRSSAAGTPPVLPAQDLWRLQLDLQREAQWSLSMSTALWSPKKLGSVSGKALTSLTPPALHRALSGSGSATCEIGPGQGQHFLPRRIGEEEPATAPAEPAQTFPVAKPIYWLCSGHMGGGGTFCGPGSELWMSFLAMSWTPSSSTRMARSTPCHCLCGGPTRRYSPSRLQYMCPPLRHV